MNTMLSDLAKKSHCMSAVDNLPSDLETEEEQKKVAPQSHLDVHSSPMVMLLEADQQTSSAVTTKTKGCDRSGTSASSYFVKGNDGADEYQEKHETNI